MKIVNFKWLNKDNQITFYGNNVAIKISIGLTLVEKCKKLRINEQINSSVLR